jgi:dienelactone hydrolase
MKSRTLLILILTTIISASTIIFVSQMQFNDNLKYKEINIKEDDYLVKGLLTYPSSYNPSQHYPGVIIFHGFSATKEMMRGFSEEFANQGFIALTVDALGHGQSSHGIRGEIALKTTGLISFRYLLSRTDIDTTRIGLVGHSMGGSILTQVTSVSNVPIASVVIGNSLNPDSENPFILNQTSPSNLLVAMGRYDELFTIDDTKQNIAESLGLDSVKTEHQYGSFANRTARKIIISDSDHLLEVIDPEIIENAVRWISNAVNQPVSDLEGWRHVQHQFITVVLALVIVVFILLNLHLLPKGSEQQLQPLRLRYHSLVSIFGFLVGFPFINLLNSLFTALFIGWFLSSGLLYLFISSKFLNVKFTNAIKDMADFSSRDLGLGILLFLGIFLPLQIMFLALPWDLRFAIPFFSFVNAHRFAQIMFPIMIFGIFFFLAEHRVLIEKTENPWKSILRVYLARSWIFLLILLIHYTPIILFNFSLTPLVIGFLVFFLVGFVPVILIITFVTEYARHLNINPIIPSIVASGIISWVLASTLPFS